MASFMLRFLYRLENKKKHEENYKSNSYFSTVFMFTFNFKIKIQKHTKSAVYKDTIQYGCPDTL